jgi:hypothetical protein
MDGGRVGEERRGKETDGCPLTKMPSVLSLSCLLPFIPCLLCYILITDHL